MYYVWRSEMREWRNTTIELLSDEWIGNVDISLAWSCETIKAKLPPVLTYAIHPGTAPVADLMWSVRGFDLCSPRAIALLREFGVPHETVPALVRDKRQRIVSADYAYVHFLCCTHALDWERSDIDVGVGIYGNRYVRKARHLVLNEEIEQKGIPVFRLAGCENLLLVHALFRGEWEWRGLTGATFEPLDAYPQWKW
ncbi:MAG: hypothetical protein HY331_16950 [Chloroflexi bacterium]|nr:hypothetical protein [Chloroflexota bacterium]